MPNEIASLSSPFHDAAMLETQEPERAWLNLSLAQQAIWLDARISAASEYQVSAWSRFTQPLQEDLFRESIRLLVARHDTLRLRVDDELPRQWLDTSEALPLSILDLPNTADPDAGFHAHVKATLSISMPLGDNPLFHVELVRARNGVSFMTWRFHQLIADSASVLLTQQLWANAYQSLVRGDSHLLLPASSCLDTLKADSSYLDSLFYDEDLAYWVTRLSPVPPRLIADMKARPVAPGAVPPAIRTLEGPPLLTLQTSARAVGVPLLHTVYALFTMMLARRYGQWDVVAGMETHVSGAPGTVVLGNTSRMMPVRCQFEPTSTLADGVRAFSVQVQEDLRHRRMPIDIVARSLDMIGQGRAGLFESSMTSSPDPLTLGEVAPSDFMTRTNLLTGSVPTRAASPISLHLDDSQDQLQLCLQVNTDYLLAAEAATLATLLESVLTTFADAPQTMLDEVSTLAPEEQVYLLDAGQGRVADFPTDTLDALFTEQSLRTPSAVAIVGLDGAEVTYAELASRTTRIARRLAARGIREGEVVGVRMVRSTETILALLGILKAGAVYLPLDPGYPPDRLAFMIEDANAALVLESLDGLDTGIAPEAEIPPLSGPTRLAYLIYTSGTTGRPKGVAVAHAAPVNLAFARRAGHDPIGPGDRVLAAISVGFDVSIGQLLLPLLSGAAIVIAPDLRSISPWAFWGLLARERVTHINSVPSFLDTILDAAPEDEELSLKKLMLGGEALAGPLVRRIHQALPSVQVINMYGPTEACIDATFYLATPADYTTPVLPIGKPLANYRVYILNPRLELTGIGVTGELYLGGAGLAEGYLHLPELTTDRFIQDPFHPGQRLYRTGDRARWNLQGQIEFLGRIDQQVKIRGFRVEPAEIAAVLLEQDDVAQAVVVPYAGPAGTRLTAYLVPKSPENPPQIDTVRAHAASRLPDYMVPASFQILPALPLTTNGKLDLKALPAAENTPPKFIAPRTPTEDKLAELFAVILGIPRVSVTDNFFELGGHSLLAANLVSRIRQLGVRLQLRDVFDAPTVEALARKIDLSFYNAGPIERDQPQPRPEILPLSFPQQRLWYLDQMQQDSSYNIPIAFELQGLLDLDVLKAALARVVERHEILRTRIRFSNGHPSQSVLPPSYPDIADIDLARIPAGEPQRQALAANLEQLARATLDLTLGNAFRAHILRLAPQRHVLAIVVHQAAFDGWSVGILIEQLTQLYGAFLADQRDPLPVPTLQYIDFTLLQRQEDRTRDLRFWMSELNGAPPTSQLPLREGATRGTTRIAKEVTCDIDAPGYAALLKLANQHKASLFMLLHAAFALLLARWSQQEDVVIGTRVANRNHPEFDSVIGPFVNTLALRTQLHPDESFSELLRRVRNADLAAFAHQHQPFAELLELLQPLRSLDQTPIFQAMLILQNTPTYELRLTSVTAQQLRIAPPHTQFDLTLSFVERDGRLEGHLQYASNRLDAQTVERFSAEYARLLAAIVRDPGQRASSIEVMEPNERHLLLNSWVGPTLTFPTDTLDALFTEQSLRTPSAVAIVGLDGAEVTYAELASRTTRIARRLAARGIREGEVVGVRMVRSTETILALLGILKAGAVYLPLDPGYPPDRLAFMIEDANAALVLESLDGLDTGIAPEAEIPPLSGPTRLAYLIYTSGTTGRPKGVAVAHAAPVNLAFARRAGHDPIGPGDRVLAAISVGFDVSIGQLLLPLLSGAAIVIAPDLRSISPWAFWGLLARERVTHINSVPSFLDTILDAAPEDEELSLKKLMLGGEALAGPLVRRIHQALPSVQVINMYGPTEACIDATFYLATPADYTTPVLPIGKPLANYRVYILNPRLELTGIGVTGELYLGGAGLAEGYLHLPELTTDRFIQDPFHPGQRLYRTGDRARWNLQGQIEFLGRIDQQVKIRGFRVEPAEIAAVLLEQDDVAQAVVVPYAGPAGTRLTAYLVPKSPENPPQIDTVRAHAASRLPDYMVPASFQILPALPLTNNGKLDLKALPAAENTPPKFIAPRTPTEDKLAELLRSLLPNHPGGVLDHFFEAGGDSLIAIRFLYAINAQLGVSLPLQSVFELPTIAALASHIDRRPPDGI